MRVVVTKVFFSKMPPKQKRVTRKERLASKTLADDIAEVMRREGFKVTVTEFKCGSGKNDKSRRDPDEEEILFLNKDKKKWPKIVEREKERMLDRNLEQLEADEKFTTKLNHHICTEMVKLADNNMFCIKKKGFYFTATPGIYITAHWTEGEAFSEILVTLEKLPNVVLKFLKQKTSLDDDFKDFVKALVVADCNVQSNVLKNLAKQLCDLKKEYRAQFHVRGKKGVDNTVLVWGNNDQASAATEFSQFFAKMAKWLRSCQQVRYMCQMGQWAVQESVSNRGKASVPSEELWRKKLHDFKTNLKLEIPETVAKKLDDLLLVFGDTAVYKVKFGHPCAMKTPKFYLQLEAICSSRKSLIPDIHLNKDGLCDEITALPLPLKNNAAGAKEVAELLCTLSKNKDGKDN